MINLLLLAACSLAEADDIAAVMLATGQATVLSDGVEVPASTGLPLDRQDVLKTGPQGAIIVHLSNDHLVRIDADLELAVADIVMLAAPQSSVPPGKQLADLLYPDEESALGSAVDRAERVAGWHSRLTAAEGVSGLQREAMDDEASATPKTKPRASRDLHPSPPPADSAPPVLKEEESRAAQAPAAPEASKKQAPQLEPSQLPGWFQPEGRLRLCIVDWAGSLGVPLDRVQIRITIVDGQISRISNPLGLRLPPCARVALEGQAVLGPPVDRAEFQVLLSE